MLKSIFKVLGGIVAVAAIGAAYAALYLAGASAFELVVVTALILLAISVAALVLHLRALHRALFQHAQIAYKGFMLNFFLEVRALMRDRATDEAPANELVWNLLENYFRSETELYNTVIEELHDKTSMMHMLERGRMRKEGGLADPGPVEPLYAELHELLARLRDEREARHEAARRRTAS
ncbi:MAG TPA: hypothetical protein VFH82_01060 [Gemmatimonadota bacterium]|jgi:hypothetical protein|nr:hypothetical protein [Gemmatimonadota bacterium]